MKSIITSIAPSSTVLSSITTYFTSLTDKAADRIADMVNGVEDKWLTYKQYLVRSEDLASVINEDLDKISVYDANGRAVQVDADDIYSYLGDNLASADLCKNFIASLTDQAEGRLNEGSIALRQYVTSKYGAVSANLTKYVDSLCAILESSGSKIDKLKQFMNFHTPRNTAENTFFLDSAAEEYSGINPWVSFFCGPMPDFSSIGQCLLNWWAGSWRMVGKFYQAIGEGISDLFRGMTNWFKLQVNPHDLIPIDGCQDYSLNSGYWGRLLPHETYNQTSTYITVRDYILDHDGILCIPTLGCTIYIANGSSNDTPRENVDLAIYVKKHIYDYATANQIRRVSSLQGQQLEQWDAVMANIGDLRPSVITDDPDNESYLYNGLIQAEALIPLGIALISDNNNTINQVLSAYQTGLIDLTQWMRPGESPFSYYSNAVTNNDWYEEYKYGEGITNMYLVNTLLANVVTGIINSDSNATFTPYMWVSRQLKGCASVKTDGMNLATVQDLMKAVAIGTAVVATTILVGKGILKLRSKAFTMNRLSEQAIYDSNKSDSEVFWLSFKAKLLSKISGLSTNAAISTAPAMMNAYSGIKQTVASAQTTDTAIGTVDGKVATVANKVQSVSDDVSTVAEKVAESIADIGVVSEDTQNIIRSVGSVASDVSGVAQSVTNVSSALNTNTNTIIQSVNSVQTGITDAMDVKFSTVRADVRAIKNLIK